MEKNSSGLIYIIQKKWKWGDCKLVIRRTNLLFHNQQSYQTLEAQVQLQSDQIQEPFFPIITFQKQITFRKDKGFIWRKNKVIPNVKIKIPEVYFQLLKEDEQIISTFCQISAAFPKKKQNHYYLQEIKLKGQNKKVFSDKGEVQFQNLYFTSDSKAVQQNNFCFIISICVSTLDDNRLIIKSMISSSVNVQPSKIIKKKIKKPLQFCLLTPKQFSQPIFNQNEITQRQFRQSKFSLFNFLAFYNQNPDKILKNHPFYFAYHFSNLFSLYYNQKKVKQPNNILQYFYGEKQIAKRRKKFKRKEDIQKHRKIKKKKNSQIVQDLKKFNSQNNLKNDKKLLMIVLNPFWKQQNQKLSNALESEQSNLKYISDRSLQNQIQRVQLIFKIWTNRFLEVNFSPQCFLDQKWVLLTSDEILTAYQSYYHKVLVSIQKKSYKQNQGMLPIQDKISQQEEQLKHTEEYDFQKQKQQK